MENAVVALQLSDRDAFAPNMQEILTKYGDNIETRIGLHNYDDDQGLILIQFSGDDNSLTEFEEDLTKIDSLNFKALDLKFH